MFDENWKTVEGFIKTFGEPKKAMLMDLTQEFVEAYHRLGTDPYELVDGFGVDWIELLMKYNEGIEDLIILVESKLEKLAVNKTHI